MSDMITGWLQQVQGTVPPLVVEIVLRDGTHHFLHHFGIDDPQSKTMVLGIWDFRALSENGVDQLKERLNQLPAGSEPGDIEALNLDWANLRVPYDEIAYCIEWHDRYWPEERRPKLGFRN